MFALFGFGRRFTGLRVAGLQALATCNLPQVTAIGTLLLFDEGPYNLGNQS
jgi:hypothetical protein